MSPALQVDSLPLSHLGSLPFPHIIYLKCKTRKTQMSLSIITVSQKEREEKKKKPTKHQAVNNLKSRICVCVCVCARAHTRTQFLSHVLFFLTPWTVARQTPLSMEFSRQEYWSGLLFPTPGDLPDPGIEHNPPASPALAGRFFTTVPPGQA